MTRYLLDTNHLGAAIRAVSPVRERIQQLVRQGDRFGTCVPVLCELEVGLQQLADLEAARRRLTTLLKVVRIWPLEADLAESYGRIWLELRAAGRALSQVDIMLSAFARQMKLTLLTSDRDFEALPDLTTENWL